MKRKTVLVFSLLVILCLAPSLSYGQLGGTTNSTISVSRYVNLNAPGSGSLTIDPAFSMSASTTVSNAYRVSAISSGVHNVTANLTSSLPQGVDNVELSGGDIRNTTLASSGLIAIIEGGISSIARSSYRSITYTVNINDNYPADGTAESVEIALTIRTSTQ